MPLTFYNTLTNRKEEFEPLEPGVVRMYNCGPTVYMFAHIGNFRAFMLADLLRRYLEYKGLDVRQVMNITDVGHLTDDADEGEDKLEQAARREKTDPWQIAESYTRAFFEDLDALNIRRATHYPKATDHIDEMIEMVERLLRNGHAYEVNGCVYYDVTTFPDYGRLSGNTLERLQAGARLSVNPDKRNPHDFSLWVTDPDHVMKWESPWGVGYPGWHLECSTMSQKYLGETIDIHTGGEDNIFPHHECEIAQAEGATGRPFVKYWMHVRHLFVEGEKMSKSLGNFYTLRDLLEKGLAPMAIRYALLSAQYRQPLNFTFDAVESAAGAVDRLTEFVRNMEAATGEAEDPQVDALIEQMNADFEREMDDDLNIAPALAHVFEFIRQVYKLEVGAADGRKCADAVRRIDTVLGVLPQAGEGEEELDDEVEALIAERQKARADGDYARADAIRDQLAARGITLKDTPDGVRWERK
ncbi:MAG: cysteine--tRNA ligase [Planctomycetota bacterium]